MDRDLETTRTITLEPDWENVRRYVLNMYRSDPVNARKIAAEMGCEAPELPDESETR